MVGKMNVLVYSGNGTTVESVRHCLYTMRRLLTPNYAVIPVTGETLLKEPWTSTCALVVFPGGADLGYCRTLNGEGNRRIIQFVHRGGAYLGFCAGGYYGSKVCEFEVGNKKLEVVGSRELAFFPGICRGGAFAGFIYHSEDGARAAELKVDKKWLENEAPGQFRSYYNGGGVFVDAEKYEDKGVEVLASFTQDLAVESGEGKAAIIYCKVGEGAAILTGPHPEFAAANLDRRICGPEIVDAIKEDDQKRTAFLKSCLTKLGLTVNQEPNAVPSLSRLHLSSLEPSDVRGLVDSWKDIIVTEEGEEYIEGENDTFHLGRPSRWSMGSLAKVLPSSMSEKTNEETGDGGDRILDYSMIVKHMTVHNQTYPGSKETPYFNHHAFFANLRHYQSLSNSSTEEFGKFLMYGEVVTSTNTMLEKNNKLLQLLPTGFTVTATVQVAGRGRGSNVWVSPAGSLIFSTCIRYPMELMTQAPVIFVQYIAAMAVVEGIKSYDTGYRDVPVKLKWPNDIYAEDPSKPGEKAYVKIGGILVNSSYSGKEFLSVVGIGLNTTNLAPTTSLNALLAPLNTTRTLARKPPLGPFTLEKLLARILTIFEEMYTRFLQTGFSRAFEEEYYKNWLHTNQLVTLEVQDGARARVRGITRDFGLLLVEEVRGGDGAIPTGKVWGLQSDGNSFDFFKGLVKRKV
ncbi:hypothetical protein FGG08_003390 [Glutinoglossum americanum]|uniref:BPL/LPL catalytic domain-containing protein n=1 Tax=Glutinoglossum americanum TaxID=1670608 RepID=A0A9P8L0N3_9PEZI|nr:hypothetical protein FGG08_003390 [Glutinoglossum americanum]